MWLFLYGAAAIVLTAGFFSRYPLPDPSAKLSALLSALYLFGGAFGAGSLFIKRVLKLETSPFWNFIFSIATGLGILSLTVVLVGWLPVGELANRLLAIQAVWLILFVWGGHDLSKVWRGKNRVPGAMPFFSVVCVALIFVASGLCLLSAFSPITYYDSLVYHLALPSYYLIEGRIAPAAFNLYSYFPANMEMLYLFVLGRLPVPEYVINLLLWGISLLTSMTLFHWSKEMGDSKTGWLAAALWWTMPAVLFLSVGGYVEIPLAFFSILALRAFAEASQKNYDARWILLSGLMGGFAFATKYTGAMTPLFLGLYLLWTNFRGPKMSLKIIGLFGITVALPVLPWLVRNALYVGNPFFPFFYRFLGGDVGWTQESAGAYFNMLTEYGAKSSVFFELLRAPIDIAWNAAKFGGGFDVLGDFGWLLFILTVPLGLILYWKHQSQQWLVVFFVCHFLTWFLTKPVLRFLIGILPVVVLISTVGLKYLIAKRPVASRVTLAFLGLFTLSNFFLYYFISNVFKPFQVPLGESNREDFLKKRLAFYDAFDYLNHIRDKSHRVFLLGEQRSYHLKIPHLSASIFAPSPIARLCNTAQDPALLDAEFRNQNITDVLLHNGEIERLGGLEKFGFSEEGKRFFQRFLEQKYRLIYSQNHVSVYERNKTDSN